jgi:hypothetical protein
LVSFFGESPQETKPESVLDTIAQFLAELFAAAAAASTACVSESARCVARTMISDVEMRINSRQAKKVEAEANSLVSFFGESPQETKPESVLDTRCVARTMISDVEMRIKATRTRRSARNWAIVSRTLSKQIFLQRAVPAVETLSRQAKKVEAEANSLVSFFGEARCVARTMISDVEMRIKATRTRRSARNWAIVSRIPPASGTGCRDALTASQESRGRGEQFGLVLWRVTLRLRVGSLCGADHDQRRRDANKGNTYPQVGEKLGLEARAAPEIAPRTTLRRLRLQGVTAKYVTHAREPRLPASPSRLAVWRGP